MLVGFLQFAPQERSVDENIEFIISQTKNAKDVLIVLPELFLSSYYNFVVIEKSQLPKILFPLLEHSRINNISFIGSIAVKSKKIVKNQGIYICNGEIIYPSSFSLQNHDMV